MRIRANELMHYGTPRHSGRYPWGSGKDPQSSHDILGTIAELKSKGLTDTEIARGLGLTTTQLRAQRSIATNAARQGRIDQAVKLRTAGNSLTAIGKEMGINESSVRSLLAASEKDDKDVLTTVSNMLRDQVAEKKYVDIGEGVETHVGVSATKLKTAVAILQEEGYTVHNVQTPQVTGQNKTTVKVLAPPGTTYRDVKENIHSVQQITSFSEDGGRTMLGIHPPLSIDPKRLDVVHDEEGGSKADGTIYVRPGVKDVSIGANNYAQVRVKIGDKHYIKGMAVYNDKLPTGVDLQFHTSKTSTGNKLDALKKLEDDPENPFKSSIRQIVEKDEHGKEHVTSAMNMVGTQGIEGSGAEGSWDNWSRSLSTQLLSKQDPRLAQQQLDVTYERKKNEFETLKALTNPTVRKELLEKFASGADSSAVHLKAAALPRQATKVLLPVNSLKKNEIYAPSFKNGEQVALVRYPHGGTFEIPVLTVNNGNREGRRLLGVQAKDAVGVHHSVAQRLSGADFDGDTVVVIPNNKGDIKSTPALKGLEGFDAKKMYPEYPGMKVMSAQAKATQMGLISNLITDMTIKGATTDEIARAVRHSMVVIDAEKHRLNYQQSYKDNGIRALYTKYASSPQGGGSTLISKATSERKVQDYKLRSPREGGPIDPLTGKLVYRSTPEGYVNREGVFVPKKKSVAKLANTDDAFSLLTDNPTKIEVIYAEHSNRLKALANEARKEVAQFKPPTYNPSAKKAYANEVKSLNAKLNEARKNKPLERQAQIIANRTIEMIKQAHPDMDPEDLKKRKTQALVAARIRTGASRYQIRPTPEEWAAIQAGAVSYNQLSQILRSSDIDHIKELATPSPRHIMTPAKTARARSMLESGYTQAEVAEHLGVSLTTLKSIL